jgi:lipid II:glycine glycyltransferase (peptidoglycan interpeptide bridge formation enzyme)
MIHVASLDELKQWNELIAGNPDGGHFLQSAGWAHFRRHYGWQPRQFVSIIGGKSIAVLMLERSIPTIGKIWYCPKGPGVTNESDLEVVLAKLYKLEPDVVAIKLEPELAAGTGLPSDFRKSTINRQVVSTGVVDLDKPEDELIASFKQKTRYNIRLSERKGVTVEAVDPTAENFEIMYRLMATTHERSSYFNPNKGYILASWRALCNDHTGQLFLASHEDDILAGAYIVQLGNKAWYKDGGSTRAAKQNLMAPYALQWQIMRWLQNVGFTSYDLMGLPAPGELDDPNHPLSRLAQFKLGFKPELKEFMGTYDIVFHPKKYQRFTKLYEKPATSYAHRIRRQLWY